jgi:glyoxylase-like metal-dependent hydrolase (beta-lactamase superfamily II)
MKIYCIETGKVKVKKNQVRRPDGWGPAMAKVLFGRDWSDWLPIYAWVIDHPEGIYVVDTGETHRTSIKGYLPAWHPYFGTSVKFDVKPEEEIGPQLINLGINPHRDVKKVIMTHLHTDHAGGMSHFRNAEFLIDRNEYKNARGLSGILAGYLPHRWPEWLDPGFINFNGPSIGPFERSQSVTSDKRIRIIPTPGHVPTHISVLVEIENIQYLLAGDTSYRQDLMLEGRPDGVGVGETRETLLKIKQLAREMPLVYLPSHDPESRNRLNGIEIVETPDKIPA